MWGGVLSGAGLRLPSVPEGGGGSASPQSSGTFGGEPPLNQGSCFSRPYQLMISSDQPKPWTGQPSHDPSALNGTRCVSPWPRSSSFGSSFAISGRTPRSNGGTRTPRILPPG